MKKNFTLPFALLQSLYAMVLMPFFAYGTYYLQSQGFNNVIIGIVLAVANILAVLIQPLMATMVDKEKISLPRLMGFILLGLMISAFALRGNLLPLVFFALVQIAVYSLNPLLNAYSVSCNRQGYYVDFGVSKGLSSLSYAIFSLLLGSLLKLHGSSLIPMASILISLFFLLALWKTTPTFSKEVIESQTLETAQSLLKKMPSLWGVLFSVTLIYSNYSMFNSYLVNTIRHLGGGESHLGIAVAIASASEVPILLSFSKLMQRVKLSTLLCVSAFFFTLKTFLAFLAPGVWTLYFTQAIQMFSFGIYLPASVYYMASITEVKDQAKGQAYMTSAATLGSLIASVLGGIVVDAFGVPAMLLLATTMSAVGTITMVIFTRRLAHEQI